MAVVQIVTRCPRWAIWSRSRMASWFSGSPNQPPWLYSPTWQPSSAAASAIGRSRCDFGLDAARLARRPTRRPTAAGDPKLRMDRVPPADVQDQPGFVVERARKPPGVERNALRLKRVDFGVERGNVLGPVVVSEMFESQTMQHRRALLRPAMLRVERHDAPGDQALGSQQIGGGARPRVGRRRLLSTAHGPPTPPAPRRTRSTAAKDRDAACELPDESAVQSLDYPRPGGRAQCRADASWTSGSAQSSNRRIRLASRNPGSRFHEPRRSLSDASALDRGRGADALFVAVRGAVAAMAREHPADPAWLWMLLLLLPFVCLYVWLLAAYYCGSVTVSGDQVVRRSPLGERTVSLGDVTQLVWSAAHAGGKVVLHTTTSRLAIDLGDLDHEGRLFLIRHLGAIAARGAAIRLAEILPSLGRSTARSRFGSKTPSGRDPPHSPARRRVFYCRQHGSRRRRRGSRRVYRPKAARAGANGDAIAVAGPARSGAASGSNRQNHAPSAACGEFRQFVATEMAIIVYGVVMLAVINGIESQPASPSTKARRS